MQRGSPEASSSTVAITGDGNRLALEGALDIRTLAEVERSLRRQHGDTRGSICTN
jgi:hypothetical protein